MCAAGAVVSTTVRAATTAGSNWLPEQRASSSSAAGRSTASREGRVVDIAARGSARGADRELVAGEVVRIAGAVPALVARADELRDVRQRRRGTDDPGADQRVLVH